jgi:thymidylate synthase
VKQSAPKTVLSQAVRAIVIGRQIRFELSDGFPMVTAKTHRLNPHVTDICGLNFEDFELLGYEAQYIKASAS